MELPRLLIHSVTCSCHLVYHDSTCTINSVFTCFVFFSLFYSSKHQYAYPLLRVAWYCTPPSEYSKCLSLEKHWIFYVRYSFCSDFAHYFFEDFLKKSRDQWISEAITVSAKWAQRALSGPSQKIGHHTLVTRSYLTCCQLYRCCFDSPTDTCSQLKCHTSKWQTPREFLWPPLGIAGKWALWQWQNGQGPVLWWRRLNGRIKGGNIAHVCFQLLHADTM